MGNLNQIEERHRPDRWRDIIFIAGAVLLAALSIGSLTGRSTGSVSHHQWTVTMEEQPWLVLEK